ncbi:MgtC/SapB family protein [soil metagenome]
MELSVPADYGAAALRILIAAGLSLPIGIEREIRGKAAGMRTLLLLAASAAALGWLSVAAATADPSADPTRIASYTVAGVSFLGGGLIIGIRSRLYGLTSAVAAFTVTAIGLLAGMGYLWAAVTLAALTVLALRPVDWLKDRTIGRVIRSEATLHIAVDSVDTLTTIQQIATAADVELRALEFQPLGDSRVVVQMSVRGLGAEIGHLADELRAHPDVRGVATVAGAGPDIDT